MADLREVEALLAEARRRSRQSSLGRRAPANDAVPILLDIVSRLAARTAAEAGDATAWLLLSQAHECLVDYAAAIACLERYMGLTDRSRESLKRLAGLHSAKSFWDNLGLNATQLKSLGDYLDHNQDRLEQTQSTSSACSAHVGVALSWKSV
jgi:hypothetical protein